jgi:starch phosphorylase
MDGRDYIAYFTMEIGLLETMPTYAGGLGILAGDTVRSASDLGIQMLAVTLLHRRGYFRQRLDAAGWQSEENADWPVAELLQEMEPRCSVEIEGRQVHIRAWKLDVKGVSGAVVPVLFLDTDLEQNTEQDRAITHHLYGGDAHYRLCQEVVLGIGGIRMLRTLGYNEIKRYHMNEGHAALLTLELAFELSRQAWDMSYEQIRHTITPELMHLVRPKCIFTTHTPVPAGHDTYPLDMVHRVITGYQDAFYEREREFCPECMLDMTYLALDNSHYINGVAKRHGKVTQQMFEKYDIHSITNGVHVSIHYQWRTCVNLGGATDCEAVRRAHPGLARRQLQPALRTQSIQTGRMAGAPAGETAAHRKSERAHRHRSGARGVHHWLRATRSGIQTRRPAVLGYRQTHRYRRQGWRVAVSLCGQGASAGYAR